MVLEVHHLLAAVAEVPEEAMVTTELLLQVVTEVLMAVAVAAVLLLLDLQLPASVLADLFVSFGQEIHVAGLQLT
jgi:hypothetical protein